MSLNYDSRQGFAEGIEDLKVWKVLMEETIFEDRKWRMISERLKGG